MGMGKGGRSFKIALVDWMNKKQTEFISTTMERYDATYTMINCNIRKGNENNTLKISRELFSQNILKNPCCKLP